MIFLSSLDTNDEIICILNIFTPQVVDPAHPPMNIKPINIIKENPPQLSYWALTYPVPVKIDITLNKTDLKSNSEDLFKLKYKVRIKILKK